MYEDQVQKCEIAVTANFMTVNNRLICKRHYTSYIGHGQGRISHHFGHTAFFLLPYDAFFTSGIGKECQIY